MRYRESQQFRQRWIWIILIPVIVMAWAAFVQQIVFGIPFGTDPAPDIAVWITWLLVGIGIPALFWKSRLIIEVEDRELRYRWTPFINRSIPLEKIKSATAQDYRPIWEYGGWGIRYGGKDKGWVYSMGGNRGVFIECHDGKCLMLGTERPVELEAAINEFLKRSR